MVARWLGAILFALVAGCGADGPNDQAAPEAAFAAFRDALIAGDRDVVWAFLSDESRSALQARAGVISEALGAPQEPLAILRAAWVPDAAEIDALERVEYSETHATLQFTTVLGHSGQIRLERSADGWRVDLALPKVEAAP